MGIYKHQLGLLEYFILETDKEVGTVSVNNCIKNLLKLICLLQKNSRNNCCLEDGCAKPFLGPINRGCCYNTRVITLYNKDGSIFNTNYIDNNGNTQNSSLFRVEKVFDNCATLLILQKIDNNYLSTKQTITVKLDCICAIHCIDDVIINCL